MEPTIKKAGEVQSILTPGEAKFADFREMFLSLVSNSYPGLRQLKFKRLNRHYTVNYVVRGAFGPRELSSWGKTMEDAASRFLSEIRHKVVGTPLVLNKHYGSLEMLL